jgi:ribonuclease HII
VQAKALAPTLELEYALLLEGYRLIAGVDEVGRGSWAGPVVAAAVVLPLGDSASLTMLEGLRDSKQLSAEERTEAAKAIRAAGASIGIGWSSHHVVDGRGIAAANRGAMVRAIAGLKERPDCLLIDFMRLPECPLPQVCIPKGDEQSLSVAAASIVAKVVRDRWMTRCEGRYPGYGFASHKGYGTEAHRTALARQGPSPIHRLSFRPLARLHDAS